MITLKKWAVVSKDDGLIYDTYDTREEARQESSADTKVIKTEDHDIFSDEDDYLYACSHCGDDADYEGFSASLYMMNDDAMTPSEINDALEEMYEERDAEMLDSLTETLLEIAKNELIKELNNMKPRAKQLAKARKLAKATYLAA